ncbi:MAG: Hsp20/alpha crystallin family protein [Polyangiaceae bacterium]|jgi:HSP20 family protein
MLTRWDAVTTLDRMFDDVMGSMLGTATSPRTFDPAIDVRANENEVTFICDVPGVKQEDLEVTLENHVLTIKGTRKFESKDDEQVMLGREYGSFTRAYTLPDYVDDANLVASLADGVLTIRIPKQAKAKPRKIQIGNGHSKQLKE